MSGDVFEFTPPAGKEITSLSVKGEEECAVHFVPGTEVRSPILAPNETSVTMSEIGNDAKQAPMDT